MRERHSGFSKPWLVLGFEVLCVLVYELLDKRGASERGDLSPVWSWTGITALASPLTWLAMMIMIVSLLSWLYVFRYITQSVGVYFLRGVDVLVPLCCWFI